MTISRVPEEGITTSSLYAVEKDERIFYFSKSVLDKEIKMTAAKAELPPIRVHDLKHPYVKLMTKNNICKSRNPKLPFSIA